MHGMRRFGAALAVLVVVGLVPAESRAGFSEILAFGDSLTDVGNAFTGSSQTFPPSPPYFQGHFSNGPIWVEQLAPLLGVPVPTPFVAGGTDYAVGGAETGLTGLSTLGTPNIGTQINLYLGAHATVDPAALVVVWGGANDFLNAHATDPVPLVNNLAAEITTLAGAGARTFLVPNLPQLGLVPLDSTVTDAQRAGLNALTLAFNSLLDAKLNQLQSTLGVTIDRLDMERLVRTVSANRSAYGFSNVTSSALADNNLSGAGYLFWDGEHPTTAAHGLIAAAAVAAVPEPGSVTLLAVAGACLLARRRLGRAFRGV